MYEAWEIADLYIDKTLPNWHDFQLGWPQKFFIDREGIVRSYTLGYSISLGGVPLDPDARNDFMEKSQDEEAHYKFLKELALGIME